MDAGYNFGTIKRNKINTVKLLFVGKIGLIIITDNGAS